MAWDDEVVTGTETRAELVNHIVIAVLCALLTLLYGAQLTATLRKDALYRLLKSTSRARGGGHVSHRSVYAPVGRQHRLFHVLGTVLTWMLNVRALDPLGKLFIPASWLRLVTWNTLATLFLTACLTLQIQLRIWVVLRRHDIRRFSRLTFRTVGVLCIVCTNACFIAYRLLPADTADRAFMAFNGVMIAVEVFMLLVLDFIVYQLRRAVHEMLRTERPRALHAIGEDAEPQPLSAEGSRLSHGPSRAGSPASPPLAASPSVQALLGAAGSPPASISVPSTAPFPASFSIPSAASSTAASSPAAPSQAAAVPPVTFELESDSHSHSTDHLESHPPASPPVVLVVSPDPSRQLTRAPSSSRLRQRVKPSSNSALRALRKMYILSIAAHILTFAAIAFSASTLVILSRASEAFQPFRIPEDLFPIYGLIATVAVALWYSWLPRSWEIATTALPVLAQRAQPESRVQSDREARRRESEFRTRSRDGTLHSPPPMARANSGLDRDRDKDSNSMDDASGSGAHSSH